ncbi:formylglycine-generating enzyme family protein [Candidatus Poribacteria bacterium]|nr:formylglycine-generating enzyme family protein [Candidatus Poribacteria bacterium]
MQFLFDRTGFPLIRVPEVGLDVQLLPVTKVQFERFIAEPNGFGDTWYEEILGVNPRVSYRQFTADNREGIFITGLLPEEAVSFARWMGDGFTLLTIEEWRTIYKALEHRPVESGELEKLRSQCSAEQPLVILEQLREQLEPRSWLSLSLMYGGLVEWVRGENSWAGLGVPRYEFYPNLWDPLADVVSPLHPDERLPYFGIRLVRKVE